MKKAKLMVSALAILAVLSGVFAFNVERFSNHFVYTGKLKSGTCTIKTKGAAIMSGIPNVAASTVAVTKGCPDVYTVQITDN